MADRPRLTHLQKTALQGYLRYRARPPRVAVLMLRMLPAYLVLAALGVAIALLARRLGWGDAALWALGGAAVGIVLRDIGTLGRFARVWPVLGDTLDWQKVEQALRESEAASAEKPAEARVRPRVVLRTAAIGAVLVIGIALAALEALAYAFNPVRGNPPGRVVILTTDWCGYCAALREHLAANDVAYTEIDTEKSVRGLVALWSVRSRGVPVTVVGSEIIRGFDLGAIENALEAAGHRLKLRIAPSPPGMPAG